MKNIIFLALVFPFAVFAQMPTGGMPDMGQMFLQQMDANHDGQVTLAEFRQPSDQQFAMMDGNKDGAVSAAEARAFSRMMMQRMQQMQQSQRNTQQMQMPMPR